MRLEHKRLCGEGWSADAGARRPLLGRLTAGRGAQGRGQRRDQLTDERRRGAEAGSHAARARDRRGVKLWRPRAPAARGRDAVASPAELCRTGERSLVDWAMACCSLAIAPVLPASRRGMAQRVPLLLLI